MIDCIRQGPRIIGLVGAIALFPSCHESTTGHVEVESTIPPARGDIFPASLLTSPGNFVDDKGREWVWLGPAAFAPPDAIAKMPTSPGPVTVPDSQLSRAELREKIAQNLTPIGIIGGNLYTLSHPDYDMADRIMAMSTAPSTNPHPPVKSQNSSETSGPAPDLTLGTQQLFSSIPSQVKVRSTTPTSWAYSAAPELGPGCTAAIIAPYTAMTAGHCLYNYDTKQWYSYTSLQLRPGMNNVNGNAVIPANYFYYNIFTTTGWVNNGDSAFDFGGLNYYGSGTAPGIDWGFMGTVEITNDSAVGNNYVLGYPQELGEPYGSQWGAYECCAISSFSSNRRFYHYVSIEQGNSGGCNYNVSVQCFGVINTSPAYSTNGNTSRKWNSETYNFFATNFHFP